MCHLGLIHSLILLCLAYERRQATLVRAGDITFHKGITYGHGIALVKVHEEQHRLLIMLWQLLGITYSQVLIKREDVELAEMQPFNPGKMEWPPSTNLDRSSSYPIQISLKSKSDGKSLLHADGVIAP